MHQRIRLGILAITHEARRVEFGYLRLQLDLTAGGPDLDPSAYGAAPHPSLGPTEPDLDRFELAPTAPGDLRLTVSSAAGALLASMPVRVR